ncbi:MAG: UDP-N-acetylmuramoyl-L-alanyl-D-glutamate--2,6-diaminopimelate ligase [Candidatus Hydrogenedentes bacterium]|nr:UDP-N-acetylmuramoyl-L-alanyl-D-glutamate--2,6-diaminopimelate ligase [Candidatus Hydrogenedentota bacterium]
MTQDDLVLLLGLPAPPTPFSFHTVTEDSRRAGKGTLFVAISGEKNDGHDFADAAAAAGASAMLGNRPNVREMSGIPYIYHDAPRRAAGLIAHALAGDPTHQQCVIGVTGTNGKTSTAFLTQKILDTAGRHCANFGTLGYDLGKTQQAAAHTTPFGEDLARLFAEARQEGCNHVVMEASSHALEQDRVAGIHFNVAAFTNLTQDHLDYHKDMDAYLKAKIKLFNKVDETLRRADSPWPCFGVINAEDPCAPKFEDALPGRCHSYGSAGSVRAEGLELLTDGAVFRLVSPWGAGQAHTQLVGRHNVLNALCAVAITAGLGVPVDTVLAGLEGLASVPGRFEPVIAGQPFQVIVDYAHTDDGLRNALTAARAVCSGRIIVTFGCGGDRDKGKRPKMGAVAAELADYVVLTSDNPRTEDPCRILLDVEVGLQRKGKRKGDTYTVIESRREAIRHALSAARPGDLVLIAGKGHENYQIIGTERRHFDDREEALNALREIG